MDEDHRNDEESPHKKIEDIMRERERLDKILHQKFRKRMTIVFTDVCGYTKYMDTRGDIAGRAWMQKHNDIVLPLIEKHQGKVLSIMGDGVMSSFENTLDAIKACIAIQKGLLNHNRTAEPVDEVHVTIGVNTGEILMDDDHIAGDTVNVASRIETKAEADQILISETAYEDVRGSEDIICRKHGSVAVKGKDIPLELYRIIWQDEEIVLSVEPRVRSMGENGQPIKQTALNVLELEVTRENNRLKISSFEHMTGEVSTIRQYEEIPISIDGLKNRCNEVVDTLNRGNRKGILSRDILAKLREIGQTFRNELFTPSVEETFQNSKAEHLVINMDDQLVQVPWELLHDGRQFLCQGFNLGRLVKTRQNISGGKKRLLGHPLKVLVLADPGGDLRSAFEEGKRIRDYMEQQRDLVNISFRSQDIPADFVRQKIRYFDLVHFAGHADYAPENPGQSGWRLSDGNLQANEIKKMTDTGIMPALIFSNACQSARTDEWSLQSHFQNEIFGLANAFILAGVKHYIGTFWEVLDEPSKRFAIQFYRHLFENKTVGEAVRMTRHDLMDEYGEEAIVWASYLLYGDPTYKYVSHIIPDAALEDTAKPDPQIETLATVRAGTAEKLPQKTKKPPARSWMTVAGIAVIIALAIWLAPAFFKTDTSEFEQSLIAFYQNGDFENALTTARTLKEKDARVRLAYLIPGNIHLREGDLETAQTLYQKAMDATKGSDIQLASALMGLGRIASLNKENEKALDYYRQASHRSPSNSNAYLSQALLMEKNGNISQALSLLENAAERSPGNPSIAAITREIHLKNEIAADEKKQERINTLVQSLVEEMNQPSRVLPSDGWTSQPLTAWIMDVTTQGYTLQEGEDTLLVSGMTDQLLQHGRVQIVERALLDKLLTELKLSASNLTDQRTALALGKLLAARLIVSGKIIYSGPHTQVSLRMFETETGRITAALNETEGSAVPISVLAEKLTRNLLQKIETSYPIRGKIKDLDGAVVRLNIGSNAGVVPGQTFKVLQEDILLQVSSVTSNQSFTKIISENKAAIAGQRIEILKPQ
jgi:class 3 adenylate cyclase/CHAT domain-containing protein/TolA-binding protein